MASNVSASLGKEDAHLLWGGNKTFKKKKETFLKSIIGRKEKGGDKDSCSQRKGLSHCIRGGREEVQAVWSRHNTSD